MIFLHLMDYKGRDNLNELKIIDAHLHFGREFYFDEIAITAGHKNNADHLAECYKNLGIIHGIVMSNGTLNVESLQYPKFLSYCVGLDNWVMNKSTFKSNLPLIEENLKRRECVGVKLYPGYLHFYVSDDDLKPIYNLAAKYDKPVAIHTGLTAMTNAYLKYSHPLVIDEAAAKFPNVKFVMCHLGEPYINDAVAVLSKNPNVAADLSGMLEGKIFDMDQFLTKKKFYIDQLRGWLEYLDDYTRIMFGTDWPLANLNDYIEFTKSFIPKDQWSQVFYKSAVKIYHLERNLN